MTRIQYLSEMESLLFKMRQLNDEAINDGLIEPGLMSDGEGKIANVHLELSYQANDPSMSMELACLGFYAGDNIKVNYYTYNGIVKEFKDD